MYKEDLERAIPVEKLTIEALRHQVEEKQYLVIAPNEIMKKGLIVDLISIRVLLKLYDTMSDRYKERFEKEVLVNPKKLAFFMSKMWNWVQ